MLGILTVFSEAEAALAILPVVLLLGSALALVVIKARAARLTMVAGLVSAGVTIVGSLVVIRVLPSSVVLSLWRPESLFDSQLRLTLDISVWRFVLGVATVLATVLLTELGSPAVVVRQTSPFLMVLPGLAILVMLSANLLTVVTTWALMDIATLVHLMRSPDGAGKARQLLLRGGVEAFGLLLLMGGGVFNEVAGGQREISDGVSSPWAVVCVVIGVFVRLGVLQWQERRWESDEHDRGLGILTQVLPPAVATSVLARQLAGPSLAGAENWLMGMGAVLLLWGSARWLVSAEARHRWRGFVLATFGIGLVATGVSSVDGGGPLASAGLVVLLAGTVVLIGRQYSLAQRVVIVAAGLVAAGMPVGPGSGFASAVAVSLGGGRTWSYVVCGVGLGLLAAGFAELLLGGLRKWGVSEGASRGAYGIGFALPMLAALGIGVGMGGMGIVAAWVFFGLTCCVASVASFIRLVLFKRRRVERPDGGLLGWAAEVTRGIRRIVGLMIGALRGLGHALEGEGGMLWLYVVLLGGALVLLGGRP